MYELDYTYFFLPVQVILTMMSITVQNSPSLSLAFADRVPEEVYT